MTIYIHEDHYGWLLLQLRKELPVWIPENLKCLEYYFGINIKTCSFLPKWCRRWEFPATPFVEYSKEDEIWAKPVKFGRLVFTNEPYMIMVDENYTKVFSIKNITRGLVSC